MQVFVVASQLMQNSIPQLATQLVPELLETSVKLVLQTAQTSAAEHEAQSVTLHSRTQTLLVRLNPVLQP